MKIKGITDEDFINYKLPSMFIATATCSFKCDKEYGSPICQNSGLAKQPTINISAKELYVRYCSNDISRAIVFGGLEPFEQIDELIRFITLVRGDRCHDDIVIYTGYTKEELSHIKMSVTFEGEKDPFNTIDYNLIEDMQKIESWDNIIIKYGRYVPNQQPHFDPVLGVYLASDNQYAERIS